MDFLKSSLGLGKKKQEPLPVYTPPAAPLTAEQRIKLDMDRLYDNKKTPYTATYTSEVNVKRKGGGAGLSESKSGEVRRVSPTPKRAEDKKEKKGILGALFSKGGGSGETSEGSGEVYGKNSYQYVPQAKSSSSAPQQSYQRTGVVKPVQKDVQENTSLYDQKIGRRQSNMYHVQLDKPVEVEETNDDDEYDNSEEMARLAEQDRLRREAEEKKYKMSLKFSPTTNSMYYDKNVENIRKGYTKAKSFVGGAQLAPLSFWASKTASRLNLDLSNYTKEIQTYRIDLPSESNCYFEVTINSEQTPMSYIQIGMMEIRHTIQHTKEKRFINDHGQTICLGVGRTKGGYSFDALFHRKAERKSATAAFLNNQDIITRKDYRAMQTQKYGNGQRLLNQDTYAAIDNGKLHNKYGHHQLHLSKGSVIGCYLDYVNRCIHISADGQFTGHLLPLLDFHERNRDANGNFIREAFCPVITALPDQEFFINVGQEPFKLDSTSVNGDEEDSDYGRSSFQELIENSKRKNGGAVEEGKGNNKEDVNYRAAYLEVEDGAFVHEAVLHRCMARNSSQTSTPHVDIWDEDDNEWLNISEELHPWFFKGEAYDDYEEGAENHIDNVTAPMIPSDQLITGTKGGVHDGENILRPLRRKSNFVSAEDFQDDVDDEGDEDDNKSIKSITISEADKFDSQIRDNMQKRRNTLQLKSMETGEVNFNTFKNKLINPDLLVHDFAHNANPEYYNSLKTKRKMAVAGEEVKDLTKGVSATKVLKDVLRDDEIMLSDLQAKYVRNKDNSASSASKGVSFDNTATIEVKDVTETAEQKYRRLSVNVETKLKFEMEKHAAESKKGGRFKALHKQLEDVGARIGVDKNENSNKKEKAVRSQSIRRLRNSMHGLVDTHNSEEEEEEEEEGLDEDDKSLADEEHLHHKSKLDRKSIHALQQNKQAFNKQSKEQQSFNLDVAEERRLRMASGTIQVPEVPSQVGAPDNYFRQKMNEGRKSVDEISVTPSMEFKQTLSNMRGNVELHEALEEQPLPHEQYKIQDEIDNVSDFSDDDARRFSSMGMQDPAVTNNANYYANNGSNRMSQGQRQDQYQLQAAQQAQKPQKKNSVWGTVKGMFGFGGNKNQSPQEQSRSKERNKSFFGFGGKVKQKVDQRRRSGDAQQRGHRDEQQGRRDDRRRDSRGNSIPMGRSDTMPSGMMSGQIGGGDRRRSRSDPNEHNQRRPSEHGRGVNHSKMGQSYDIPLQHQQQDRQSAYAESRHSGYANPQMGSQMNGSRYSIGRESYQQDYHEQQQHMGHNQQNMNNMSNVLQEMNTRNSVHNVNMPPPPSDDGRVRRRTMAMPEEQQEYAPEVYQESYYGGSDGDYDAYNVYDQYEHSEDGFAMENEMNNYRNDQYNNSDLREQESDYNNYQKNEYNNNEEEDDDDEEEEEEGGDTFDVEEKKTAPPTKAQQWMNNAFAAINPDHVQSTPEGVQDVMAPMRNASIFKQALAGLKPVHVRERTLEKQKSKGATMRERREQQHHTVSASPKPSPSNRRASVLKTQLRQSHDDESEEELDAVQQELQRERSAVQQNGKAAIPPPPAVGKQDNRRKSMASQLFDSLGPEAEADRVEDGKKKRRPTVLQQQAYEQADDSDWEKDSTDGYRQSTALDILDMMPENAQEAREYRNLEQKLGGDVPMEHCSQAQGDGDDHHRRSSVASDDYIIDPSKRKSMHAHMFGEYEEPAAANSNNRRPSMVQMTMADDVDGSDWEDGEGASRRRSTALDILNMVPGDVNEATNLQNREWELRKSISQGQDREQGQEQGLIMDAEEEEHHRAVAKEMEIERRKSAASDLFASVEGPDMQNKAPSRSMSMALGGPAPPPPAGVSKSRSMSLMPGGIAPPRPPPGGSPKARSTSLMPNQPPPPAGVSKSRSMSLMPGGIAPPRPPPKSRSMSLMPNQSTPSGGNTSSMNMTPFAEVEEEDEDDTEVLEDTQRHKSLASHVFEQAGGQEASISNNRRPSMVQEQVAQDVAESDWEGDGRRASTALEILDMVPDDAQQARAFQNAEKELRRQSLAEVYQSGGGTAAPAVPETRRKSIASHVFGEAEEQHAKSSSYGNRRPSMIQEEAAQDVAESDWEGDDRDGRRASTALEILEMVPDDVEQAMAMQNREWELRKRQSVSESRATKQRSISADAVAEIEQVQRRKSVASHVFGEAEEHQQVQRSSGKGNRRPSMIQEQAAQGVAESDWEADGGRRTSTALEILDMLPSDAEQAMVIQNREWELRREENGAQTVQAARHRSISADAVNVHNQNQQNTQRREFLGPAEASYNLKSDTSVSERREMNIYDRSYIQNPYANLSSDAPQDPHKQRRKSSRSPEFEGHGRKTVIGANLAALNRMSPNSLALSPPKVSMTADAWSVSDNSDLTPSGSEAEDDENQEIMLDQPQHMQKVNSYESEAYYNSDTGQRSLALQEVLQHRLAEERKRLEEDQKRRIIMMVEQLEMEHRERILEYQERDLIAQQRIDSMENVQRSMQDQQRSMADKERRLEEERLKLEREKEDHFQALAEALETERLQLAAAQQKTVEIEHQKIAEAERLEKERRLLEVQRLKLVKELELEKHKFQLEMLEEQHKKTQIMREEGALQEDIRESSQYALSPNVGAMASAQELPGMSDVNYHDAHVANSTYSSSKDGPPTDKDIAYLYGSELNSLSQVGNSTIQSASQVAKPSIQAIPSHVKIIVPGPPPNTVDAIDISTRASMIVEETLATRRASGLDNSGYHETYRNPVSAQEFRAQEEKRKTVNNMFIEGAPLKSSSGIHPALLADDENNSANKQEQDSPSPNRRNSRSNRRSFVAHMESTASIPRRSKTFNGNNDAFNMGNGRLDDETQISDLDDENNRGIDDPRNTAQEIINNLKWNLNGGEEPDDDTINSGMVHEYLAFLESEHEYEQHLAETSDTRKPLHDWMQEQVRSSMKQAEEQLAAHTKTWNELYKRNGMLTPQEQQQLLAEREEAANWKQQYRMLEVSQEQLQEKIVTHEQNREEDKALTVDELNTGETTTNTTENNIADAADKEAEASADNNDDADDDSDKEPEPPKYEPILDNHHAIFIERHVEAAAKLKVKVALEDEEKKKAKEIEEQEKLDKSKQGRASLFKMKKRKKLYRHQQRKPAGEQVPGIDELKERYQMLLKRLLGKKDIKDVDKEADVVKMFSDDPFESREAWYEYYETHPDEYEKMMKPHWKKYPQEKEEYFVMKAERERLKKLEECRRDTPEYYRAMMLEKKSFGDSGSVGARSGGADSSGARRSSVAESPIKRKSILNEMTLGLLGGHDDLSHLAEHPSLKKVKARDHPGYESNESSDEEEVFDVEERQKHRDNFMVRASFVAAATPSEMASNVDEEEDKGSSNNKKGKGHASLRASICHDHPGFVYEASESESEEEVEQITESQKDENENGEEAEEEKEDTASQGSKYDEVVQHRARTLERRSFAAVTIPVMLGHEALTSGANTQSTTTASTQQDDSHPSLRASICRDHPGTEYDSEDDEEESIPTDIQYMRMISQRAKLLERASFASTAAVQNGTAAPSHTSTPNSNASTSTRRKTLMNELTFGIVSSAQEKVLDDNHPSLRATNESSDEESGEEDDNDDKDKGVGIDKKDADSTSVASLFGAVGDSANPTIETMQKETQLVIEKATEEVNAHNSTELDRMKRENEELMQQIENLKKQNAAPPTTTTTAAATTTAATTTTTTAQMQQRARALERRSFSSTVSAKAPSPHSSGKSSDSSTRRPSMTKELTLGLIGGEEDLSYLNEHPSMRSSKYGKQESSSEEEDDEDNDANKEGRTETRGDRKSDDTSKEDTSESSSSEKSIGSATTPTGLEHRARMLERASFSSQVSAATNNDRRISTSSQKAERSRSIFEVPAPRDDHPSLGPTRMDSSDSEESEEEGEEDQINQQTDTIVPV